MRIQKHILLVIFALLPYFSFSQITLDIKANDDNKLVKGIKPKKTYVSETAIKKELSNIINELQSEGYLLANIDSTITLSATQTAYISAGNKYKWGELKINQYDKILFADDISKPCNYKLMSPIFLQISIVVETKSLIIKSLT